MPCCRSLAGGRWRSLFGPAAVAAYIIFVLVVIPLCLVEIEFHDSNIASRKIAWFVAGMLVIATLPISLWDIAFHLYHYTNPPLQKYIIRILWMVPVYSICSWIGLRADSARVYMASLVSLYEAFAVYSFMCYLTTFLAMEHDMVSVLRSKPQTKHTIPFCFLSNWKMGREFWQLCRFGVYQYTAVNLIVTIIALSCEFGGKYEEGEFSGSNPWLYLIITTNISQIATKEELQPIKPLGKFLCIKAVVFFSFWQGVFLAIIQASGGFNSINPDKTKDTCEPNCDGWDSFEIQDLLICIEMLIAAIAHHFVFSYKPFIDQAASRPPYLSSFWSMFDFRDVHQETLEHAGDAKLKLSEYGKRIRHFRSPVNGDGEEIPLLLMGEASVSSRNGHSYTTSSVDEKAAVAGSNDSENEEDQSVEGTHQNRLRQHYALASFEEPENIEVDDVVEEKEVRETQQLTDTTL